MNASTVKPCECDRNKFYRIAVCGKTASTVRRRGTGPLGPVSTLRRYEQIKSSLNLRFGALQMMGVGLPEAVYRNSFQTAIMLLRLNAVVVSDNGKGISLKMSGKC